MQSIQTILDASVKAFCSKSASSPSVYVEASTGIDFKLVTLSNSDAATKQKLLEIFRTNMKHIYELTSEGWDDTEKEAYLFAEDAFYIIVYSIETAEVLGFLMLKFEYDDLDVPEYPVLFLYELQISEGSRGMGVGSRVRLFLHYNFFNYYNILLLVAALYEDSHW